VNDEAKKAIDDILEAWEEGVIVPGSSGDVDQCDELFDALRQVRAA
jgi:hypothetical protein